MIAFNKYERNGAYHWGWYNTNKFGYKDQVDYVVSQFPAQGSILDIGCGDGLTTYKLHEKGLNVTGIDLNEEAIRLGKLRCNMLSLDVASVYDIHSTYDYALLHDVIEHLENPRLALSTIRKSIRNYCIISTPNANMHTSGQYDYQLWTPEGISELLNGYDFEFLDTSGIMFIKMFGE